MAHDHDFLKPGDVQLCVPFLALNTAFAITSIWLNMPLADTELSGGSYSRILLDLYRLKEFRFIVNVFSVAGAAGADLRVQASPDESTWTNLDGSAGPEVAIDSTGIKDTGWIAIPGSLRQPSMVLRVMGKDGDGVVDPRFLSYLSLR